MHADDQYDGILVSLHNAALDDTQWPAAANLIDGACRAKGNMLGFGGRRRRDDVQTLFARFIHCGRRRQDWEQEYFDVYYPQDERIPRLAQMRHGRLAHVRDLYTAQEMKTSPVYNEAMLRADCQNSLHVRLDGPSGTDIGWVICDPSGPGGWDSGQTRMIERLLPHIRQFVFVRDALAGAGALGAPLAQMLESARAGVILLDRRGRIVEANDRARRILQLTAGLSEGGGFLRAWLPADHARLQTVLAGALPPAGAQGASGSMTVQRPLPLPRLVVHVNPLNEGCLAYRGRRAAALVVVIDTDSQPRINPDRVAEILGLTLAEGRVAALLSEGKTVQEIAASMHRQKGAVYWLLHQIYRKHGISRQVDLVRLVLSLPELSGARQ